MPNEVRAKVGRLDTLDGIQVDAHPHLVVMAGQHVGRTYALDRDALIGRAQDANIVLEDDDVSRQHARIRIVSPFEMMLEDLESRNGTYLNDVEVRRPASLKIGDRITLGNSVVLQVLRVTPAQSKLRQRQRLEALGRLTAGIAHDLNNMNGAILATLDFLDTVPLTSEEEVRQCHADLRAACERVSQLTPRLLAFSRGDSRGHVRISLSAMCEEVVQLVERTFDRSIQVVGRLAPELHVLGDPVEMHQVLMNLCLNARDAMPGGGHLTLSSALVPEADARRLRLPSISGRYVRVSVEDDGQGMDEETKKHIYQPFFTTKGEAGTGLGLATAREILAMHRGVIEVQSEPGRGTRFDIYLPRFVEGSHAARSVTPQGLARVADDVNASEHTILLVDDEPTVRRAYARILRGRGYEVLEAADGAEAVATYESTRPRPSLVLLDVNMPNMGGVEALQRLRELDPDARIILLSGQSERDAEDIALRRRIPYLSKPCNVDELLVAIADALSSPVEELDAPPTMGRLDWSDPTTVDPTE